MTTETTPEQARELAERLEKLPAIAWTGHRGVDYACIMTPDETTGAASIYLHGEAEALVEPIAELLSQSTRITAALLSLSDQVERLTGERDAAIRRKVAAMDDRDADESTITALSKERDALREALVLAANRLARCALDHELFTEKYYEVAEWGEEARAALNKEAM